MKQITLDKELNGKPLNLDELTEGQKKTLCLIGDINDEMIALCDENERAELTKNQPEIGISDKKTVALIISDMFEVKRARIKERMQPVLKKAIDIDGLGGYAFIQRMCARYGLSNYIRRYIQKMADLEQRKL